MYLFMLLEIGSSRRVSVVASYTSLDQHVQETPVQVLVLPSRPDSGDLEDKDPVVLEQIIDLLQKGRVTPDSDMLGHLQADNLVELSSRGGEVTEVAAEDSSLRGLNSVLLKSVVSKGSLLSSEGY
jgi:hypothetical protein